MLLVSHAEGVGAMNMLLPPNEEVAEVYHTLNAGHVPDEEQITSAFRLILTSPAIKARDTQLGAFLSGLMVSPAMTPPLCAALIRTALSVDGIQRQRPPIPASEILVAVAGSGKKGHKTFNISTPSCLVASAAGAYVVKPCSCATSSLCGSQDFAHLVGAQLLPTHDMETVLAETQFGLFSIEQLMPRFDSAYGGRLLAPTPLSYALPAVASPVESDAVLYGFSNSQVGRSAEVLALLGVKNATVVSSTNDSIHFVDELSSLNYNYCADVQNRVVGRLNIFAPTVVTASPACRPGELRPGTTPEENIQIALRVLRGEDPGPREDTVALNAAAILLLAQKTPSLTEGFQTAREIIRSGLAYRKLEQFVAATQQHRAMPV